MSSYFSEFERIVATAADDATGAAPVLAELAGRWAARDGWEDGLHGVSRHPGRNHSISGQDGELTIWLNASDGRCITVPTRSVEQTADLLVAYGVLPAAFSSAVHTTLDELGAALERLAETLARQAPETEIAGGPIARAWFAAADAAWDYRAARLYDLARR